MLFVQRRGEREDRAKRIRRDDLDVGVMLLEAASQACDGSTRARTGDDRLDLAVGLRPDLLGGAELMGQWVVFVSVLVEDVCVGQLLFEPLGDTDVRLGGIVGSLVGRTDDGRVQCAQDRDFLSGHLLREGDDRFVAFDGGDQRQADTAVFRPTLESHENIHTWWR